MKLRILGCSGGTGRDLRTTSRLLEVFISHLKPGEIEVTMQEIQECAGAWKPRLPENNQIFDR